MWQQIESCVSVSTISLTAFRIMFVAGTSRRENSPWRREWSSRSSQLKRRIGFSFFSLKRWEGGTTEESRELDDVTIPGGTLTGMRTAIGGNRGEGGTVMFSILDEDGVGDEWPLRRPMPVASGPPTRDGGETRFDPRLSLRSFGSIESFERGTLGRLDLIR